MEQNILQENQTNLQPSSTVSNQQQQNATEEGLGELNFMDEYIRYEIKKNNHMNLLAQLPPPVYNKIRSLRKLQLKTIILEADFHHMVYELERKFQEKNAIIFKKRYEIINGIYQPNEDECDFPNFELPNISRELDSLNEQNNNYSREINPTGIPQFWLTILKYVPMFDSMVKENDELVLKYLTDIRVTSKPLPNLSFTLEFYFAPNEFFYNEKLTKEYLMKCSPDPDDPFSFDGPEIYKSLGCTIDWKKGKDFTERLILKRTCDSSSCGKTMKNATFFDFFNPPEIPEDEEDPDYESINSLLENDFEIGHYIKERIIPKAILYFTGEQDDDMSDDSTQTTVSVGQISEASVENISNDIVVN